MELEEREMDQKTEVKPTPIEGLGFDPVALREKYRAERDKRLRPEGNAQYIEVAGSYSHFRDDPYVEPGFTRAPLTDEVEVAVIGGGFGGLLTAAHLRMAGVDGVRIIDRGGDFGGTWYWNRYPGAACDIESYIYLPLLEEIGYVPVEKYSRAEEIFEHSRAIGRHFDLYRDVCFQTEVTELRWDDEACRWLIQTNRGDAMKARFVCMALGFLDRPKLPGIPGIETFKGHTFHTSRWDYEYTGGTAKGGLVGLKDKRVGVIGTGATAVQCVPYLGEWAAQLYVFQRTPSTIGVRNNHPTDPAFAASLEPGWQRRRMENFNTIVSGGQAEVDLVSDGWTDILRNLFTVGQVAGGEGVDPAELLQLADFRTMEQIRTRVDAVVQDKETAEALKPYYDLFCKRPCFHDEYLNTFNRPNVKLVDTQGQGVERVTEDAVIVGGRRYPVDCLIFATGFEVGTSFTRRAGFEVFGRGGLTLSEKWKDGVATLHGMQTHGFPNCFVIMTNVQAGITANFTHSLDYQGMHIAHIVKEVTSRQARSVEVTEAAEKDWVDTIVSLARLREKFLAECTPGYYNREGNASLRTAQDGAYGAGWEAYREVLDTWREEGSLSGLELKR
jgi:cation diffusion facilitator CzcD-associated flavoprotein CzcO